MNIEEENAQREELTNEEIERLYQTNLREDIKTQHLLVIYAGSMDRAAFHINLFKKLAGTSGDFDSQITANLALIMPTMLMLLLTERESNPDEIDMLLLGLCECFIKISKHEQAITIFLTCLGYGSAGTVHHFLHLARQHYIGENLKYHYVISKNTYCQLIKAIFKKVNTATWVPLADEMLNLDNHETHEGVDNLNFESRYDPYKHIHLVTLRALADLLATQEITPPEDYPDVVTLELLYIAIKLTRFSRNLSEMEVKPLPIADLKTYQPPLIPWGALQDLRLDKTATAVVFDHLVKAVSQDDARADVDALATYCFDLEERHYDAQHNLDVNEASAEELAARRHNVATQIKKALTTVFLSRFDGQSSRVSHVTQHLIIVATQRDYFKFALQQLHLIAANADHIYEDFHAIIAIPLMRRLLSNEERINCQQITPFLDDMCQHSPDVNLMHTFQAIRPHDPNTHLAERLQQLSIHLEQNHNDFMVTFVKYGGWRFLKHLEALRSRRNKFIHRFFATPATQHIITIMGFKQFRKCLQLILEQYTHPHATTEWNEIKAFSQLHDLVESILSEEGLDEHLRHDINAFISMLNNPLFKYYADSQCYLLQIPVREFDQPEAFPKK